MACSLCGGTDHSRDTCPWQDELQHLPPAQRYEAEKQAWQLEHPGATPEEHEAAARAIAERLGI